MRKQKWPQFIITKEEVERCKNYELIQNIYDESEYNKNIIKNFRKAVVKHPHEWDAKGYEKLDESKPKILYAKNYSKNAEIIGKLSSLGFSSDKLLTYYHPFYFYNHIKATGMLEFNPYNVTNNKKRPRLNQDIENGRVDFEYEFKTNLGFSSAVTRSDNDKFLKDFKYLINGKEYYFATLNCPIGYSYAYENKNKEKKPHTGIDLPGWTSGFPNVSVFSFIYGEVWGVKNQNEYGNTLLIKDKNSNFLYLLAHLEKTFVVKNDEVHPGQEVALTGSTGTGGGGTADNVHLHLEVFDVSGMNAQNVVNKNDSVLWTSDFDHRKQRRDPLDNTKKYLDIIGEQE